jgi:hypothetical protein
MTRDDGTRRTRLRQAAWAVLSAIFVVSLVLSVFATSSYTEIAKASILSYVATDDSAAFEFGDNGTMESVNMTISFTIVNPSREELRVWILTYKGWLRDCAMEDGTDTSRWRVDGRVESDGTVMRYYPVFVAAYSFDAPQVIVPPKSNMTVTRHIEVNKENYPDILANIADIRNYSDSLGKDPEWLHYTTAILFIESVPSFSGPNHDANLIRRFDGWDITPGVEGAGP